MDCGGVRHNQLWRHKDTSNAVFYSYKLDFFFYLLTLCDGETPDNSWVQGCMLPAFIAPEWFMNQWLHNESGWFCQIYRLSQIPRTQGTPVSISLIALCGRNAKRWQYYFFYKAAKSITTFQAHVSNKPRRSKRSLSVMLLGCKSQSGPQWFSKAFKRSHTVDCTRLLTHHGCGCKTCRWAPRVQSPPGWRAWRSGQPPGVGADHPPSCGTATARLCQHKNRDTVQKLGQGVYIVSL